jgi:hypothetical protein
MIAAAPLEDPSAELVLRDHEDSQILVAQATVKPVFPWLRLPNPREKGIT